MRRAPDSFGAVLRALGGVNWRAILLFVSALVPFWLLIDVMNDGTIYAVALLGGSSSRTSGGRTTSSSTSPSTKTCWLRVRSSSSCLGMW